MPYITKEARESVARSGPMTAGEFNYAVTRLVIQFLAQKDLTYAKLNEVVGVLECAKLEFYRRAAVPYEDHKREVNGDVYK